MSSGADKRLFVVVATYNGMEWIDRCCESVFGSTHQSVLVVVDNCSTDGTADRIEQRYPQAVVMRNRQNEGFGKANNRGIRYALDNAADYIYLLNQDAWVEANVFEGLIDIMERNPQYGCTGPMQMTASGLKVNRNFQVWLDCRHTPNFLNDCYMGTVGELYESHPFPADNWLLRREVFERVGGFSPVFPHYGEDSELSNRMIYFGFRFGICPHLRAAHDIEFRTSPVEREMFMEYLFFKIDLNDINRSFGSRLMLGWVKMAINICRYRAPLGRKMNYCFKPFIDLLPALRNRRKTKRGCSYI